MSRVKEILSYFENMPIQSLRINPLDQLGRGKMASSRGIGIAPSEWGEFLIEAFRLIPHVTKKPVEPFAEWGLMPNQNKGNPSCSFGWCMDEIIAFDSKSQAYGCGKCIDLGLQPFGNVQIGGIEKLLSCSNRSRIMNRKIYLHNTQCAECHLWERCRGGCPIDGFSGSIYPYRKTIWCEGYKMFFANLGVNS